MAETFGSDDDDAAGGELVVVPDQIRRLRVAMTLLTDAERFVVEQRYSSAEWLADWTEIARSWGSSVKVVRFIHKRAIAKLREMLST